MSLDSYLWWNANTYIYSSTELKYKFYVLVFYLSIFFSCHFLLLLHYIYLTALGTLQIKTFAHKKYMPEELIKHDALL